MKWNADKYPESDIVQEYLAAVAHPSWSSKTSHFVKMCFVLS